MKTVAMLRVKNEEEFLEGCIRSALKICSDVVIFDDHSTDSTRDIARSFKEVTLLESPFTELSETSDKNHLLTETLKLKPDWVVCLDGDEELSNEAALAIETLAGSVDKDRPEFTVLLLRVLYFWNDYRTVRTDGVYGQFYVPRVFTTWGQTMLDKLHFLYLANTAGFHCGSIPSMNYNRIDKKIQAPIYHYGYLWPAMRRRKFDFYRKADPCNPLEDNYRHCIQGDPGGEPASAKLMHAGPLRLETL